MDRKKSRLLALLFVSVFCVYSWAAPFVEADPGWPHWVAFAIAVCVALYVASFEYYLRFVEPRQKPARSEQYRVSQLTEERFAVGMAAYKAEMASSLRSWPVWRVQVGVTVIGLLRAAVLAMLCILLPVASGLFGELGYSFGLFVAMVVVPLAVLMAPGWFMRNVFVERAWAAFESSRKTDDQL